ncbi:peptidase [Saccharothrix sp. S26]|uniref:Clp protease N-terminal domain-containing protein n=1 Tax=Saccharothrix sp. S26 TaxID=2907215 RepID=UPI001F4686D9|nr:Clp protease N-terminal domain-containing protein [Saccharothrix sp. S26]MCE6998784.1 peptidase [Saccharothrix sp. S26]
MFRGDHPDLKRTIGRALHLARTLGHPRTGSEHVLAALADLRPASGALPDVMARHGATAAAIGDAAYLAAPLGAGGAADRGLLGTLGVDLDRLVGEGGALDRPAGREPLIPFGAAKARRRCARLSPPLGLDAQAAYSASLRLALARREREHRPEHLALALTALDPGVAWVLKTAGVDRAALLADLAATFPPPRRNPLLVVERRLGHRVRHRGLVRRYQRTTGRAVTSADALPALIRGAAAHPSG